MFDIIGAMVAGAAYSITGYVRKLRQGTEEELKFSWGEFGYSAVLGAIAGGVATYMRTDIDTATLLIASYGGTAVLNEILKQVQAWVTKDTVTA